MDTLQRHVMQESETRLFRVEQQQTRHFEEIVKHANFIVTHTSHHNPNVHNRLTTWFC